MQRRRIEVRAVGPHQRMDFRVYLSLAKYRPVPQRAVEFPEKDGLKIDYPLGFVVESEPEAYNPKRTQTRQRGIWDVACYFNGSIGNGFVPC